MGILFPFLFSFCCFFLSQSPGSGVPSRAPHGLAYQPPLQLSPSAVEFFNPQGPLENVDPPASSPEKTSPESSVKPRVTPVRARQVMVNGVEARGCSNPGIGAAAAAPILFTSVFVVLLAMSAYYVFLVRQRDASPAQPGKPVP